MEGSLRAYKGFGKILKHRFCNASRPPSPHPSSPFSIIIGVLGTEAWTRNVGVFAFPLRRLDRKAGGLDRAWTAFGSFLDALGQRFDAALTRLGRRCPASGTGLDSDWTLLQNVSYCSGLSCLCWYMLPKSSKPIRSAARSGLNQTGPGCCLYFWVQAGANMPPKTSLWTERGI